MSMQEIEKSDFVTHDLRIFTKLNVIIKKCRYVTTKRIFVSKLLQNEDYWFRIEYIQVDKRDLIEEFMFIIDVLSQNIILTCNVPGNSKHNTFCRFTVTNFVQLHFWEHKLIYSFQGNFQYN